MSTLRQEINEILVDAYGEDEQMSSWEVAFTDDVAVPFPASLLGSPVEVRAFRANDNNVLQCLVVRANQDRQRWIAVDELDEEDLPQDFAHLLTLYRAWLARDY